MERIKNNKIIWLFILVISLVIVLISVLIINKNKKEIIYTKSKNGDSSLPYININTDDINKINEQLKSDYEMIKKYNNESYMKYEYDDSDYLSLVVEEGIKQDDYILEKNFYTYNIDTKSKRVLSFDEILNIYNLNYDDVKETIETELKRQYESEVNEGYIDDNECDYQCYLSFRNYKSIDENLTIYKKNDKVYGYLNINHGFIYYSENDYPKVKVVYELK